MNKSNKLLVGILAFVVVCVVGYALFSETITVTGTATASGSFDIAYDCWVATEDNVVTNGNDSYYTKGGTGTCEIVNGVIKTNSTLTKPTDEVNFGIEITNNGTIPAILKTVDSSNNVGNDFVSSGDVAYVDYNYYLVGYYVIYGIFKKVDGDSGLENANIILNPGKTITLRIVHGWVDAKEYNDIQPTLPEKGVSFDYNLTLGFEQITVN